MTQVLKNMLELPAVSPQAQRAIDMHRHLAERRAAHGGLKIEPLTLASSSHVTAVEALGSEAGAAMTLHHYLLARREALKAHAEYQAAVRTLKVRPC
jgi:hypothetical protein